MLNPKFNITKPSIINPMININPSIFQQIMDKLSKKQIRVRTLDTTYLHNGMILSTLGLSPHGFVFGLYPKRPHTNGDICPSLYSHDPPDF